MSNDIVELFSQIRETLNYFEESGVESFCNSENDSEAEDSSKASRLNLLEKEIQGCSLCPLCKHRTNIVFGEGNPEAEVLFIGEAPGADEDAQGLPFVGKAGKLLTRIIEAMGFKRSDVYIANIIKCRPQGNRTPSPDETGKCSLFLKRQIDIIRPKVICALGTVAANYLLNETRGITKLRGRFHDFDGIKLMPTFHPAYLLRNESAKRTVWEDVKKIMSLLQAE